MVFVSNLCRIFQNIGLETFLVSKVTFKKSLLVADIVTIQDR